MSPGWFIISMLLGYLVASLIINGKEGKQVRKRSLEAFLTKVHRVI